MIITIDGPAASGKTTTARRLAARLGVPYLDTGAMYRVVTLAALEEGLDLRDEAALASVAARHNYQLDLSSDEIRVALDGRDVTSDIRSMRVNQHTRYIAASPGVRQVLIRRQRDLGQHVLDLVTEGRDQGTAAFPHADMKFYLDADLSERAERRLGEASPEVALDDIRANLAERDRTDSEREVAPLTVPPDAIRIDNTKLGVDAVLDQMVAHLIKAGLIDPQTEKPLHTPASRGDNPASRAP